MPGCFKTVALLEQQVYVLQACENNNWVERMTGMEIEGADGRVCMSLTQRMVKSELGRTRRIEITTVCRRL